MVLEANEGPEGSRIYKSPSKRNIVATLEVEEWKLGGKDFTDLFVCLFVCFVTRMVVTHETASSTGGSF